MSIIISLDIGTSKICAAGYCTEKRALVGCESLGNNSQVMGLESGRHEQFPDIILKSIFAAIKLLLCRSLIEVSEVVGITVTGQMHGVLLVDQDHNPVSNFITWRDQRISGLAASIDGKYARNNGCGLRSGYGGATLSYWAERGQIASGLTALGICDYVCWVLTGMAVSEPTFAASWGIYDVINQQWNWEMIRELQIPTDVLPQLVPSSKSLASIHPRVAAQLGLNSDVVVYSPIGDNQASVIGARGQMEDAAVLNLGTGGQIVVSQERWQYFDGLETRPMLNNSFILVGASICGGWTYAYLKEFYKAVVKEIVGVDVSDSEIYDKMNSFLDIGVEKPGLTVDSRFCGTRINPGIRGKIGSIDAGNLTPEQFTRAFAWAMIEELSNVIPASCLENVSTIIASGNAVRRNPALLKIASILFNKPVFLAQIKEEAAVGAAIAAVSTVLESVTEPS